MKASQLLDEAQNRIAPDAPCGNCPGHPYSEHLDGIGCTHGLGPEGGEECDCIEFSHDKPEAHDVNASQSWHEAHNRTASHDHYDAQWFNASQAFYDDQIEKASHLVNGLQTQNASQIEQDAPGRDASHKTAEVQASEASQSSSEAQDESAQGELFG
jgi:hypothetical protein